MSGYANLRISSQTHSDLTRLAKKLNNCSLKDAAGVAVQFTLENANLNERLILKPKTVTEAVEK